MKNFIRIVGALALLLPALALAQTHYPYSTIPPEIAADSILCNPTGSTAVPTTCATTGTGNAPNGFSLAQLLADLPGFA